MKRMGLFKNLLLPVLAVFTVLVYLGFTNKEGHVEGDPLSLEYMLVDESGDRLFVSAKTAHRIEVLNLNTRAKVGAINLPERPKGMALQGGRLYVTCSEGPGTIEVFDAKTLKPIKSIKGRSGVVAPVVSPKNNSLVVCNQFLDEVSVYDLSTLQEKTRIKTGRQPIGAVLGKNERYLYVANLLPDARADIDTVATDLTVIDLKKGQFIKNIALENGSNALRGINLSKDGRWVYVSHNLGRFQVPTSQLEQGWMNTSAMSIIDTENMMRVATVLLDEPENGAAGIWGIDSDGEKIYVAHSGTHDFSVIEEAPMIERLLKHNDKPSLAYDLTFLNGIRQRIKVTGNGPRQLVVNGNELIVSTYFSDTLNFFDINNEYENQTLAMNPNLRESKARQGERLFNDAQYCFQGWQSCNGCHPNDARIDGLNWDLLNDGIGSPKNCKSLLLSHETPPAMITGIRASAEVAVRAGFRHIQFTQMPDEKASTVDAYLKSLKPTPSPYLVDGQLSAKAQRGKKAFEKAKCSACHNGTYFTDKRLHKVLPDTATMLDTPTLIEVWRTAPYLHDGRARTMEDVIKVERHGILRKISKKEMEDLAEYVLSL
ncbi:hypothetical protein FUAX_35320 [Fulvitalea axinellae]|uniref:Cytochrome c domain-containing protein n=1 Tax=Fulvitalea axinellae TaxID=1182444 RepID=A0AAU9DF14_9BACT|nr:hypothetical protein FUAX_35320 [Fulvitalea axinellae]